MVLVSPCVLPERSIGCQFWTDLFSSISLTNEQAAYCVNSYYCDHKETENLRVFDTREFWIFQQSYWKVSVNLLFVRTSSNKTADLLQQGTNSKQKIFDTDLDDWLTVHHSLTLVNFQLDAQNSYLFIYNTFIKILYMFRALPCLFSGGLRLS